MISLIKRKGINPQTKQAIYFPQWTRVATINKTHLAKVMARTSTFSVGEIEGTMTDFAQQILDQLLAGNAVQVGGLGVFKLRVSGKSKAKAEDVTSSGCQIAVMFDPDAELVSRLNDERQFQFVAKPTADGEQDVNTDTPADSAGGTEGNGNTNAGGGDLEP